MEDGAVADIDKARREVARPDGLIVVNPGMKFEITDGADLAEGQFKLAQPPARGVRTPGTHARLLSPGGATETGVNAPISVAPSGLWIVFGCYTGGYSPPANIHRPSGAETIDPLRKFRAVHHKNTDRLFFLHFHHDHKYLHKLS